MRACILPQKQGKKIAEDDNSGSENNARIIATLPTAGTYTVFVYTRTPGEVGNYQLIWRTTLPEDIELAEAEQLSNQAYKLYEQGSYRESISIAERVLEIREKILGKENLDVATSHNLLGFIYHNQGKIEKAELHYKQALGIRKRIFGDNHLDVAESCNNLGMLYYEQERFSEAEPLLMQALNLNKQLLGEKHFDVAMSFNNLALLYTAQGRYTEAEPLFQYAINILEELKEELRLAKSLNALGFLYANQGRYNEAETLFLRSLELRKRLLGENHPDVAKLLNNLAAIYEKQKRFREAENYQRQALDIKKRRLGEHPGVATSLNNLARLYNVLGRYQEAEALFSESLEMRKRLFGEKHPDVADSLNNIAGFYWSQDRITEALDYHTQTQKLEEYYLNLNLAAGFERQKRDYLETFSRSTDNAISVHLNSAPNNSKAARLAFETILQRKGRILDFFTNSLQILRQRVDDSESQELLNDLSNVYSELAKLIYNQPDQLQISPEQYRVGIANFEAKAKELEDQLSRRSVEFRIQSQPVTIEAIQKLIPTDTALVEIVKYSPWYPKINMLSRITYNGNPLRVTEWHYGSPRYAAYVLTSSGEPQAIDLGEANKIEESLQLFRQSLTDKNTPIPQLQESARNLDQLLMQPVRKLLGNTHKILISPDGALNPKCNSRN